MIVNPLPLRPNGREVEFAIRLDRKISQLGLQLGFDGDPLAERFPDGRTLGDLHDAYELLAMLPVELRRWDRSVALKMCQAAVFGRTRPDDRSAPPQAAAVDAKLTRERSRGRSRKASA